MNRRTRADLIRSNERLHAMLDEAREENARLRRALDLIGDEVERTAQRFFLIVTKSALREMAERARVLRSRW